MNNFNIKKLISFYIILFSVFASNSFSYQSSSEDDSFFYGDTEVSHEERPVINNETESNDLSILIKKIDGLERELRELKGFIELQNHKLMNLIKQSKIQDKKRSTLRDNKAITSDKGIARYEDETAYQEAYDLVVSKDFDQAIVTFNLFVKRYGKSTFISNAYYWLGELNSIKGEHQKAIDNFNYVIKLYPRSTKVPDSMLKKAEAYFSLEKINDAKSNLQALIARFPMTSSARFAKQRLDKLTVIDD